MATIMLAVSKEDKHEDILARHGKSKKPPAKRSTTRRQQPPCTLEDQRAAQLHKMPLKGKPTLEGQKGLAQNRVQRKATKHDRETRRTTARRGTNDNQKYHHPPEP